MTEENIPSEKPEQKTAEKYIELNAFLKYFARAEGSGGQIKHIIREGKVKVNGEVELRNKRKLFGAETVEYLDKKYTVDKEKIK